MKENSSQRGKRIRVIVVDDHPVVREGLAAIIKSQPDMELIDVAGNGQEAVRLSSRHRPDVVLMDLRMPEMDGIEATRTIREKVSSAKVIVLSTYQGDEDIHRAFKAGAKGYLLKDSSSSELLSCIRSVHEGRLDLSPAVATHLATGISCEPLTKRELEILTQVINGKSNKEIGACLEITEGTVKIHLSHVLKKLGANGRTDAIRIALERGVIHLRSL